MSYCPTCSNPIQEQWKICATCGNSLRTTLNTEQISTQRKGMSTGAKVGIAAGSVFLVSALLLVGVLVGFKPAPTETDLKPNSTSTETKTPAPKGEAQTISDQLVTNGICTSAWSRDEYEQAPSFGIDSSFWDSGEVRVCQVYRTTKSPTRWVTIITGSSLLQKFGPTWDVEFGSISIHSDKWTLVTNTLPTGKLASDPVVQAILARMGGTYSLPSK